MEPWILAPFGVVAVVAGALALAASRRRRRLAIALRIDVGRDPEMPLTIVNAGRDAVLDLEATLRFEPRAAQGGHVLERHRRARVLLPGQRLAFPLPEDTDVEQAQEFATLARRVRLDAVGRDAAGRRVTAEDVLDDPIGWIGSVHLARPSPVLSRATPGRPPRTDAS